jgi:hypothetical protein
MALLKVIGHCQFPSNSVELSEAVLPGLITVQLFMSRSRKVSTYGTLSWSEDPGNIVSGTGFSHLEGH